MELGNTKVMVAVFGPRESFSREGFSATGKLVCEIQRTAFCPSRDSAQAKDASDSGAAAVLRTALEAAVELTAFPKSEVALNCLVIESEGSEIPALIAAASLALADAGIPLFDLVSACSISRIDGKLLLDPSSEEAFSENGSILLAMMASTKQITQITVTGEWSGPQLNRLMELAMGSCAQIDASLRQALRESIAA